MQFLRKAALAISASLFTILLLTFGLNFGIQQALGDPNTVKSAVQDSGVYSSASDLFQNGLSGGNTTANIPTDNQDIRNIINGTFSPSFLKTQAEIIIDATYDWLQGDTSSLQFSIDLSGARTQLVDKLAAYARQRLDTLPECPANQIPGGNIDPFNATCVPAGADKDAVANNVRQEILASDFLKDSTLSPQTFKNDQGQTLEQQMSGARSAFVAARAVVYISGLGAAAMALAVIFLSATRRGGLRRVLVIGLTIGAFWAVLGGVSKFALHRYVGDIASRTTQDATLNTEITKIVRTLADSMLSWWITLGLIFAVTGIAGLIALRVFKPKNAKDELDKISVPRSQNPNGNTEPAGQEQAPKTDDKDQADKNQKTKTPV